MELTVPLFWTFEKTSVQTLEKLLDQHKDAEQTQPEKRLRCKSCGEPITREQERISVLGKHDHVCTNPSGIRFHIGCFAQVTSCTPIGEPTKEFTWFSGYAWRVVLCKKCHEHLGWSFQSDGGDQFHGLILNRLAYPN